MGPWDIMSHHFIEKTKPPQGVSSFTKIRLGWIDRDLLSFVKPGDSRCVFLSPLSKKGKTQAVKIPLKKSWGGEWKHYYLVENRQHIGYDRLLPDTGILVLKVNLEVMEGSGTVKLMDADPGSSYFSHATYRLDRQNRNAFIDKKNNVAVIPLWSEKGNLGVLITTPEKSKAALKAALMIRKLFKRFPEPRGKAKNESIRECVASFKSLDFETCSTKARQILQ